LEQLIKLVRFIPKFQAGYRSFWKTS